MNKKFKILSLIALAGIMYACDAELSPIDVKPDPVFDKTGLYKVNTISIYEEDETIVNISRIYGLSKEMDLTIGVNEELLTEYNNINGTNYQLMPAEYYSFPTNVKLNKTDKNVEFYVTIKPKALSAKGIANANNYVLPLSLQSSSIEVNDKGSAAQVLIIPNITEPEFTVNVPDETSSLNFIRDVMIPQTVEIKATSNFSTIDHTKVTFVVDASAVDTYNKANGTSYKLLPEKYYQVYAGTFYPETMNYNTNIAFNCADMESDDTFLLPLVMSSKEYKVTQNSPIYVLTQLTTLRLWINNANKIHVNRTGKGTISIEMNAPIAENQNVNLIFDDSRREDYNTNYGTTFKGMDKTKVTLVGGTINAGEKTTNATFQIDMTSLPFDSDYDYLLPFVLDDKNLFTGTHVENDPFYIVPRRTIVGNYTKNIWGKEYEDRVTVPAIYKAGVGGWPASINAKKHKYCFNYNQNWGGGVIHFNIVSDDYEGDTSKKRLGDFIDRANAQGGNGWDPIIDYGSWVDNITGVIHLNLMVIDGAYGSEGGFPIQYDFTPDF